MDNNFLEIITKLMANNGGFSNNASTSNNNPANSYYPNEAYQNINSNQQNPFASLNNMFNNNGQNNFMPMLLSMMGNKNLSSIAEIFSTKKSTDTTNNKKAEVFSAPNDEILL